MTGWILTLIALLSAGVFLAMGLGCLFPQVPAKKLAAAVFYFFTAAGGIMQAWQWGRP